MDRRYIQDGIKTCLDNLGILCDEVKGEELVADYIDDSITFITFIVGLEEYFKVEIPDQFLTIDLWETFDDACEIIEKCIELQRKS